MSIQDENQKVRTICALSLAAMAEAAAPYGIESFDSVLEPLWRGIHSHRGKVLAAFLKAIGFIIPLMDSQYANYYTKNSMVILIREFQSPDEEMKKIVLKVRTQGTHLCTANEKLVQRVYLVQHLVQHSLNFIHGELFEISRGYTRNEAIFQLKQSPIFVCLMQVVKQCVGTDGVGPNYIKSEILPEFFRNYWVRRMALDRRNYRALVETTVEIAVKVYICLHFTRW